MSQNGLPDFGTITIQYMPSKDCIELKALKMYLLAYRDLGIFYENAVNKMLKDIVKAIRPEWCVVRGEFTPRGGLTTRSLPDGRQPAPRKNTKRKGDYLKETENNAAIDTLRREDHNRRHRFYRGHHSRWHL